MQKQSHIVRPSHPSFELRWPSLRGLAQVFWSRLTDDDLRRIDGRPRRLIEALQQRYQRPLSEVVKEVGRFLSGQAEPVRSEPSAEARSSPTEVKEDPDMSLAVVYPRRTRRLLKLWWSRLTEGEIDAFLNGGVGLGRLLQAKYFRSAWDIEQEVQWFFDQLLGRRWMATPRLA